MTHRQHSFPRLFLHSQLTVGGNARAAALRATLPRQSPTLSRGTQHATIALMPTLHQAIACSRILGLQLSTSHEVRSAHRGVVTCMSLDPIQVSVARIVSFVSCLQVRSNCLPEYNAFHAINASKTNHIPGYHHPGPTPVPAPPHTLRRVTSCLEAPTGRLRA